MSKKLGALTILVAMITGFTWQGVLGQSASWFDMNLQPELRLDRQGIAKPYMNYWNIPCSKIPPHKVYYRLYGSTVDQTATDVCAYTASYGFFTESNQLMLSGTDTSYKVWDSNNAAPVGGFIAPIPNSNEVLLFNNDYAYIQRDFVSNIEPVYGTNILRPGKIDHYKFKTNPYIAANKVHYNDGQSLSDIKANGFGFSRNGESITLNTGRNQVVINTQTRTARRFGVTLPSGASQSTLKTALNPNGNIVFVNHYETGKLSLYNLENCSGVNSYQIENCANRSFYSTLSQNIPNFKNVELSRFLTDDSIELFVKVQPTGGTSSIDRYTLSLPESDNPKLQYLGLGDSFASGEGAGAYKATTDIETNQCHTSALSYPYLIKSKLVMTMAESVACSGAQLKDVFDIDKKEYSQQRPQSQDKNEVEYNQEIFNGFLPGYRRQLEFVSQNKPEAITLSIGGNNIGFGEKLRDCILSPGTCYGSQADREKLLKEIKNQFNSLVSAYGALKTESPKTRIYVVGYPRLALPGGDCALNVRLNQDELQLAQDVVDDLNGVVELAAKKAGVFYVDSANAFMGYRLCEAESWTLAMNGVTAGKDRGIGDLKFIGSETYHPNVLGHVLYASTILQHTTNLTAPMPAPDDSADVNQLQSKLTNVPQNSTVPQAIHAAEVVQDVLLPGQSTQLKLLTSGYFLKPDSLYKIEIHSTPILLAEVQPDSINQLSTQIEIPATIASGTHTVHITGVNINGDPVDIYKDVVVIASEQDIDGDGITNLEDTCQFIQPAMVDSDEDGIDDACDRFIDEAPLDGETSKTESLVAAATAYDSTSSDSELRTQSQLNVAQSEEAGKLAVLPSASSSLSSLSKNPLVSMNMASTTTPSSQEKVQQVAQVSKTTEHQKGLKFSSEAVITIAVSAVLSAAALARIISSKTILSIK